MSGRHRRPVLGLAALAFGLTGTASYAVQRLYAAWGGAEDAGLVVDQVHIPYYWRCDLALLHAGLAAVIVAFGVRPEAALTWLGRGPWLVLLVVLPSALAMVLVP